MIDAVVIEVPTGILREKRVKAGVEVEVEVDIEIGIELESVRTEN